jgi:fibronectin-binding autotransporter adhesin
MMSVRLPLPHFLHHFFQIIFLTIRNHPPMKLNRNLFVRSFSIVFAMAQAATGAVIEWNGSNTGLATGTNNTWDANTTANWWNGATSVVWPAPGGTDDDATFGGTAGNVTIATGGITANDVSFNTTGYTISGAALTLNGTTPTVSAGGGVSATISAVIAGTSGLTKTGSGTLILSGANTHTGTTIVSAGILRAGNAAALGSNTVKTTIASWAVLDVNGQNLGAEVVEVSGSGIGSTGALTNSGAEQINAFRFVTLLGHTTFGGPNRWDIRKATTSTFDMGGFDLTKTGANYLGLVDTTITNPGNVTINQGTLNFTFVSTIGTTAAKTITVNSGGTLGLYQSSPLHGSNLILNTGSIFRGENGTGAQNTWAGPVTATGEVTLQADGVLTLNGSITGIANLTKTGGSTATIAATGGINTTGTLSVTAGTLTVNGPLAHTGTLAVSNGTLNVNGTSSFAGTTTLTNATLNLSYATDDNSKLHDGSALILAGGTVSLAGGTHSETVASTSLVAQTANTISQAVSTAATIELNALTRGTGASINFSADNIATTDNLNDSSGLLGVWATVGGNHWAVNSTNAANGPITALTSFVDSLTNLNDANLYLDAHINVNSVQAPDAAIQPRSLIFNNAAANSLTLQGTNVIRSGGILVGTNVAANASLIAGGSITGPASGELVIHQRNTGSSLTISSSIVDNTVTSLSKLGAGTVILTGSHSYTGTTTIGAGGTLQLGNGVADGSLAGTSGIGIFGALNYNLLADFTHSIPLSGTGSLTKTGAATLTVANANIGFTGLVNVNAGKILVSNAAALGDAGKIVSLTGGGILEIGADSPINSYLLNLPSSSTGTVTLNRSTSGAALTQAFSGFTMGNSTMNFNSGANIASGTPVAQIANLTLSAGVAGTAKLNPTGVNLSIGTMQRTGSQAGNISLGGTSTGNIVTGVMSNGSGGAYTITKVDSGTWELAGANTCTGAFTVAHGTLTLSGNRTANMGGAVTVGNTAGQTGVLNIQGDLPMAGQEFGVGTTLAGAIGIVNHSAGVLSFTANNALLIGRTVGGVSGTYNLSGGELRTYASTSRGVMIGVNSGTSGNLIQATFNLTGTGFLNNASGTLQVVRGDATSAFQNSTYNQTGGTSTNGTLLVGGNGGNGANSTANFSVTGGNFSASIFSNLSRGNSVASTMTIGGTAEVTLPAFPTARGTSSTATLYFDGGVLKPSATSAAYLGGLTNALIKSGGAKFNTNSFDITVSQALLTDPVSTGGGLTKEGIGTLTLTGTNSYSGNTTVTAGTLSLGNGTVNTNLADGADVGVASGATLNLNYSGTDTIDGLTINGVAKAPGVWGSASSGAPNTDPQLTGSGTLTVTTGPSASAYDTWASGFSLTGPNAAFDFDYDNDGIENGLEWILGGNPTTNSAGILPVATKNVSGDLVLTFNREEDSITESTLKVQFGTDLASWPKEVTIGATSSGPDVNGVTVSIDTVASPDAVTVTIPASNAPTGSIFARINATRP